MLEIVFETHAWSVDNERGIATGWLPGRLSDNGKRLAHELGARRRDDGIAAVYTSDLARAVETAEIAFAGGDLRIYTSTSRSRTARAGATRSSAWATSSTKWRARGTASAWS